MAAACKAFPGWTKTTPADRSVLLLQIADAVEASLDRLAAPEVLNCGKPINEVKTAEIPTEADCFRFFAGAVRNRHGPVAGNYLKVIPA